jgi:hypothetical protein
MINFTPLNLIAQINQKAAIKTANLRVNVVIALPVSAVIALNYVLDRYRSQ